MIDVNTTNVYVRVDLASMRVIGVSDDVLVAREGKPVFNVAANFARLDYYVVEKNVSATHGVTVRPATADERTAADTKIASASAIVAERVKKQKAVSIKEFYCSAFSKRFVDRAFMSMEEAKLAADYTGIDTQMVNVVKPLGIGIVNAAAEWRFTVCQPVIDAMIAGTAVELDDKYRVVTEDALDAFLTERGFDIATYHR